jgi:hypothetical protein
MLGYARICRMPSIPLYLSSLDTQDIFWRACVPHEARAEQPCQHARTGTPLIRCSCAGLLAAACCSGSQERVKGGQRRLLGGGGGCYGLPFSLSLAVCLSVCPSVRPSVRLSVSLAPSPSLSPNPPCPFSPSLSFTAHAICTSLHEHSWVAAGVCVHEVMTGACAPCPQKRKAVGGMNAAAAPSSPSNPHSPLSYTERPRKMLRGGGGRGGGRGGSIPIGRGGGLGGWKSGRGETAAAPGRRDEASERSGGHGEVAANLSELVFPVSPLFLAIGA